MKLSRDFRMFLAALGALGLTVAGCFAVQALAPYFGRLCQFVPAAQASWIAVDRAQLEASVDQIVVGTVTKSRGAYGDSFHADDGPCRPVRLYTFHVEARLGGKEWSQPKSLDVVSLVNTSVEMPMTVGTRYLLYLYREPSGRYSVYGGPQAMYTVAEDGTLGAGEMETSTLQQVFGHPMRYDAASNALVDLEAPPIAVSPELRTHLLTPHLSFVAPSDVEFNTGDGTDTFAGSSLSKKGVNASTSFQAHMNVVCDRPDGDCGLDHMGKEITSDEAYLNALRDLQVEGYRDEGERRFGAIRGHLFIGEGVGYGDRIVLNGPDRVVSVQTSGDDAWRALVDSILQTFAVVK